MSSPFKSTVRNLLIPSLLAASALNAIADDHGLRIHHAVEVEFETERGRVHHVQGSDDMKTWTNIDDGTVGKGAAMSTLLSIQASTNKPFNFFRVVTADIPTNGPAPLTLLGQSLRLDDSEDGDRFQFLTETNGVKTSSNNPDTFEYVLARTGTNEIQLEITRPNDSDPLRKELVTLTFATEATGNWVKDRIRKGKLKDRDTGTFQLAAAVDGTNQPPVNPGETNNSVQVPTEIPTLATGLQFTFGNGGDREQVTFTTGTAGIIADDDLGADDSKAITYAYTLVETNKATLVITFKPGKRDEYVLTYKSASQGSFQRKEFKNDKLDDTDNGAFSVGLPGASNGGNSGGNGGDDHGGNSGHGGDDNGGDDNGGSGGGGSSVDDNPKGNDDGNNNGGGTTGNSALGTAPASVTGISLTFDDDIPADVLAFTSDTAGTKTHGADVDPFTYTYSVTGTATATLVATYKVDRWSEFKLTFQGENKGTFVGNVYDKGVFKSTKTGKFGQP